MKGDWTTWIGVGALLVGIVVLADRPTYVAPTAQPARVSHPVKPPRIVVPAKAPTTRVPVRPPSRSGSSTGYGSGHQAGYDWAEEHDIDDPDDCGGNSHSFIEGCEEFAEEQRAARSDDEDEEAELDE
jgi:hypothetical protein